MTTIDAGNKQCNCSQAETDLHASKSAAGHSGMTCRCHVQHALHAAPNLSLQQQQKQPEQRMERPPSEKGCRWKQPHA